MDAKTGFFYFFAAVLLFASFRVITARNPVYAVLYLVLAFFRRHASGFFSRRNFSALRSSWCTWAL